VRPTSAGLFPLLVLILLAGLTFWLQRATEESPTGNGKLRHDPDYFVDQVNYRHYDATGMLRHTLYAAQLVHFPDDDTAEVTEPKIVYITDSAMVATANRGYLDKEGKHVRLTDNVRLVHAPVGSAAETVITTSTLDVVPDDHYAHTNAPVRIVQDGSVLTGVGLEANGLSRISVLGGRVHGILESHHR
jgi:lipopolysaccharide export system protein LptC